MKVNRLFVALLLLFVMVGAVSASHDLNETAKAADEDAYQLGESPTFTDLKENITSSGDVFDMKDDYAFNEDTDGNVAKGIFINRANYTINGNNHVIDAKGKANVFNIEDSDVTITNLVFMNVLNRALDIRSSNVTTINVTFINCTSDKGDTDAIYVLGSSYSSYGDRFIGFQNGMNAIYAQYSAINVENGLFENSSDLHWGLIMADTAKVSIYNTTFANCSANYATAVYSLYSEVSIKKTRFMNLVANVTSGALGFRHFNKVSIDDCEFINVSSAKNGGAIYADQFDKQSGDGQMHINNTLFYNCSSGFAGAALVLDGTLEIENSRFIENYADYNGGALYFSTVEVTIANSTFDSNYVGFYPEYPTYGGAIYCDLSQLEIDGGVFFNNLAFEGGAICMYDSQYYISEVEFSDNGPFSPVSSYFDGEVATLEAIYGTDILDPDDFAKTEYPSVIAGEGMPIVLINQTNATVIPPEYDLRALNLTTPVKDQGYMGACWAFGMNAALESAILKAMGIETDLSENNMQNTMIKYSKYGRQTSYEGGTNIISMAYLASWFGAFTQDNDPYDELGKISPLIVSGNDLHVQDIILIAHTPGDSESILNVKRTIMEYGALTAYVCSKSSDDENGTRFFNETSYGEYNPNPMDSNHAVCVVGWNDSFSRYSFVEVPPGDGAWIVKNSWGTDWGDEGYYYVSYYDMTLCADPSSVVESFVGFVFDNNITYNKNYQYEFSGLSRFFYDTGNLTYINEYEAEEDDMIAAVGTYFDDPGVEYRIDIEVNDNIVYTQSGVSPFYGYHTIKLDKYIPIRKGEVFTVFVNSNTAPLCDNTRVKFREKTSAIQYADGSIEDLSAEGIVACIKVYTLPMQFNVTNIVEYYSDCAKFSVGVGQSNATVTVSVANTNMTLKSDDHGIATFTLPLLDVGVYPIETTFNGTTLVTAVEVRPTIIAPEELTAGYNAELRITVQILDKYGNPVANTLVKIAHDGKGMDRTTDANGNIVLTLKDSIGLHELGYLNPSTGEVAYTDIMVVSRFSSNKNINMYYNDGTKYSVRVYGDDGNPVGQGQVITIKISKKAYKVKTDARGYATLKIPSKYAPGKYTISATYKGQTVKNTLKIKHVLRAKKTVKVKRSAKKLVVKATLKGKKALKAKKVTFKFKGKTYRAKTNKKGVAKVTIKKSVIKKLKKGKKYTVKIAYLRDAVKTTVRVR